MKVGNLSGKQLLARCGSSLSLHRLVLAGSSIRIVVYHRILPDFDPLQFPFDRELVDATTGELDRELAYLKHNYNIVSFGDVIAHLDTGVKLPERPLLITFDDGYQDNYLHAFPLLRAHRVPAMLFLSTAYIDGETTFWYDWLAFVLRHLDRDSISFGTEKLTFRLSDRPVKRTRVFRAIMKYLASVDNAERLEILDEINRKYGYVYERQDEKVKAMSKPLSWQQVIEMSRSGVDIGSHTMTHPFLSRLGRQELRDELAGSKRAIEEKTGRQVSVVAYPNGQEQDFTQEVKQMAREAGYSLGLSYIDGVNPPGRLDRFAMKRLHVSPRHDFSTFRMALSLPGLF